MLDGNVLLPNLLKIVYFVIVNDIKRASLYQSPRALRFALFSFVLPPEKRK